MNATGFLWTLCLATMPAVAPGQVLTSWSLAPEVLAPLIVAALASFVALRASARRDGGAKLRTVALALGFALLIAALVSPLCRLSATLVSAHMVQHAILIAPAPALLVFAMTARPIRRAAPSFRPLLASAALYGVLIWAWHVPGLYQAALLDRSVHLLMYASLLGAGVLFWRGVFHAWMAGGGVAGSASLVLLATLIHTGMLGALLTFSGAPWYPVMAPGAHLWGLTPLADQQLAGLIMWVPMGFVYLGTGLALVLRLLDGFDERPAAEAQSIFRT